MKTTDQSSDPGIRRVLLLATGIIAIVALFLLLPVGEWSAYAIDWGRDNRALGSAIFVAAFTIGAVLMVPGSLFAMTAGYVYGLSYGAAIAALGSALGAMAAFLSGRTLARNWVGEKMKESPRLLALDNALGERSFLIVMLTRMSLLIPYNLLNYFYGITAVNARPYFVATAIGMIPAMTFYAYAGTLAANISDLMSGKLETGMAGKIYFAGGFLFVLLTVFVVHRIATGALRSRIEG